MRCILRSQRNRDLCLGLCLGLSALSLVLWPEQACEAMEQGLALCANVILPSLFPFFVLASLVVDLGMSRYLGRLLEPVMVPLFRINGACACALALGVVGGYPVGAQTAIQLYQSGQCSKDEAERLLAFCNNCGPAFILGVVGTGVFGSGTAGFLLYFTHLLASLLVGLIFRFHGSSGASSLAAVRPQFQAVRFGTVFPKAVTGALQSIFNICAFVLFFAVAVRMLTVSGVAAVLSNLLYRLLSPLGLSPDGGQRLLVGLLEVSSGVTSLTAGTLPGRLSMAAFMLGWAGLSVHCQVLAFLGDSGLSMGTYLSGKFFHGVFSALLIRLLMGVLPMEHSVSSTLTQQTESIATLEFQQALAISSAVAWSVWLAFFGLTLFAIQKSGGKRHRLRV